MTKHFDPAHVASYAMHDDASAGREHAEAAHPYRGPYQRDRDRIVHSSAFRRLAHKTQVFTGHLGDYHRSRLTHTLEVASIARTIGRVLRLNEDLIEALALMHDIGHPPFGHAGEEVLNRCCAEVGGFNHNRHALRIVTLLEQRYVEIPGLNLSREVLDSQRGRDKSVERSKRFPLLEAQVVDAADSIAYDSHDADDALELGLLDLEELLAVPLWQNAAERVQARYSSLTIEQLRRAIIHQLIEQLVSDLITATQQRIAEHGIETPADAQDCVERIAEPSCEVAEQKGELERFLFNHVYRHPRVLDERKVACAALEEMFRHFVAAPQTLPSRYRELLELAGPLRCTCDYLASMTDRFALGTYHDLGSSAD